MTKGIDKNLSSRDIQAAKTLVYMKKQRVITNLIKHSYYTRSRNPFH